MRLSIGRIRMEKSNVLSIKGKLDINRARRDNADYQMKIAAMDKVKLLEEMVRFQEETLAVDNTLLPLDVIIRGLIVFNQLKDNCETAELKDLVSFYTKILEA